MVADNVAGLAGGGFSLQDAVKVRIWHDTIANNDSLGTQGDAFADPNLSSAQPGAGIVTRSHSPALVATGRPIGSFSDPDLRNTIAWHNRQFYFKVVSDGGVATPSVWGLCPEVSGTPVLSCGTAPVYSDLGVIGAAGALTCDNAACITSTSGTAPSFVNEYVNGNRSDVIQPGITTSIQVSVAFDEGGNNIRPNYGPLSLVSDPTTFGVPDVLWDYHITAATGPQGTRLNNQGVPNDYDGQPFPNTPDVGADELP
jgi:hypothetical protein